MAGVKILTYVTAWKRQEITSICYQGIKRLQAYAPNQYDIDVLVIVSRLEDEILAKSYGFKTVYAPNKPLGNKLNIGLSHALTMDFDYYLGLGSDDLLSNKALDIYAQYFSNNADIIGLHDLAIVDSATKSAKTFHYGQMIGAGRAIRRDVLQDSAVKYRHVALKSFFDTKIGKVGKGAEVLVPSGYKSPGLRQLQKEAVIQLWDPSLTMGVDSNSQRALKWSARNIVRVEGYPPLLVDIKSEENLTNYKDLKGPSINIEDLYSDFPELKLV